MLSFVPVVGSISNICEARSLGNLAEDFASFDLHSDAEILLEKKKAFVRNTLEINFLFHEHIKKMAVAFLINTITTVALGIFKNRLFFLVFALSFILTSVDSHYTNHIYQSLQMVDDNILKFAYRIAKEKGHFENPILEEVNQTNKFFTKTTVGYVISGIFSAGLHFMGYTHAGIALHGAALLWNIIYRKSEEDKVEVQQEDGTKELVGYAQRLLQRKYKTENIDLSHLQKALEEEPVSFASLFFQKA